MQNIYLEISPTNTNGSGEMGSAEIAQHALFRPKNVKVPNKPSIHIYHAGTKQQMAARALRARAAI